MKTAILISALLASTFSFANSNYENANPKKNTTIEKTATVAKTKIQVALLLDTSSSMDGLIDQAKSRLWNIVNTLTTLKYDGKTPDIEIALYEYGNDGLSKQSNYIRQIAPLSTDLDLISEKLFSLSTNGGNEYCGAVIQDATKQLKWAKDNNNMKLIYIAGNEEFNQGGINYKEAISNALKNDIYVNTIFCGNKTEGINTLWKDGADYGKGKYFNIDSNQTVRYIATPYDDEITKCNEKINKTYIGYGSKGSEKKMNQEVQDRNAQGVSVSNYAERAVSKSKAAYKNDSWDLVDKVKDDATAISKIKKEELPKEFQNKSAAELKVIVAQKTKERETIQKEIGELAKKRQQYIDTEAKKTKKQDDLGNTINTSIIAFAKIKGYTVEK
ncbi:vWA domain-containing protein [Flavobacterium branchiarum]|uniref:VWA domain-containing protein n=1 Tax=Flavobacterium branchiarum TaxID=1114870 RepID=A0ABV5FKU1_9FLAO|nr:vWA domain-containing protein [Flavobacterium branchiarum]MDN3675254.1 vWA domain-containing protein [Flavobacterium branchiarum]